MQHQTTRARASTRALTAQLPIIARSSDAACAFETIGGVLMFLGRLRLLMMEASIEQQRQNLRNDGSAGKRRARVPALADRADDPAATAFPAAADRGGDRHRLPGAAAGRWRHVALVLARPR